MHQLFHLANALDQLCKIKFKDGTLFLQSLSKAKNNSAIHHSSSARIVSPARQLLLEMTVNFLLPSFGAHRENLSNNGMLLLTKTVPVSLPGKGKRHFGLFNL